MTTLELLSFLKERNIEVWADAGALRFSAPKGAMTAELKQQLTDRKAELLAFLGKLRSEQAGAAAASGVPAGCGVPAVSAVPGRGAAVDGTAAEETAPAAQPVKKSIDKTGNKDLFTVTHRPSFL